jgi:hypothetical protein
MDCGEKWPKIDPRKKSIDPLGPARFLKGPLFEFVGLDMQVVFQICPDH